MPKIKISEPGKKSKTYSIKITRDKITLGRKDSNDLVIGDVSVSSHHAEIRRVEGGYVLDDLNSTNGSKIDGQRYVKIDLDLDTSFKLGDVPVDFSYTDEDCDVLDEEDEFTSEQEKKKKPKNKDKKRSRKSSKDDDEEEGSDVEEDEDYDDEETSGSGAFIIIVIAFIATIAVSLLVLWLTGNL